MIDDDGREVYYHGLNVIYKSPPWLPIMDHFDPQLSYVEKDAQSLNEWGINLIRLGMMWPGAEPQRGTFDLNYFKSIEDIVSLSQKYNISTLLDMHQDSLSQLYCGEGVPEWAGRVSSPLFETFPEPLGSPFSRDPVTGWPSPSDCAKFMWADYEFTWAGAVAYQQLYDPVSKGGMREEMGLFWQKVAQYFVNNQAVIGFEIINEPFAGDVWLYPDLLLPWIADSTNLQPFYDTIAPMIREANKNHLIFFEPVTWSGEPINDEKVGFDHAPGGEQFANQSVFSYHYYDPPNLGDKLSYFQRRTKVSEDLSVGAMLTEFSVDSNFTEMASTMATVESFQTSWIGWEYKAFAGSLPNGTCTGCGIGPWNPDGSLNVPMVKTLSRTYAQAVAGMVNQSIFDDKTAQYKLTYQVNKACKKPTEIYFNQELYYPKSYTCSVDPPNLAQCLLVSKNHLEVHHSPTIPDKQLLTITIAP
uniref:Glycoside hydrolase family 5 domain-containing protein n=1 Tax=Arcella intermedia TaxID=1963864 RepID=A0A6B2L361_9EUKA